MDTIKDTISGIEYSFMTGELRPHQRLVEVELMQRFSVSRSVVRECLTILEDRGLVARHSNKGALLADFTAKQVCNLYLLRVHLEVMAADLAFDRLTPEDVASMAALQQLLHANPSIDRKLVRNHEDFHAVIYRVAGNAFLSEEIRRLISLTGRVRYLTYTYPELRKRALDYHDRILFSLETRNKAEFIALSREHLFDSAREYLRLFHPHEETDLRCRATTPDAERNLGCNALHVAQQTG